MAKYLEGTDRQKSRAYSPAVITEGGRVVWLAGQTALVDGDGKDISGNFEAQTHEVFALIDQTRTCKIITIEDPVEFLHAPKNAIISQLEVGSDTPSFEQALRQSLRQDPDVILVGELRDMDTLRIALRAADTGHQVFSTVHSANAPQTIERIIAMFPQSEHKLLLTQLLLVKELALRVPVQEKGLVPSFG